MLYIVLSASIHGVEGEQHSFGEKRVIFLLPSASASRVASGWSATALHCLDFLG